MNAKKEAEVWSAGFRHGYLASGVVGAEHRVRALRQALDQARKMGYDEGYSAGYTKGYDDGSRKIYNHETATDIYTRGWNVGHKYGVIGERKKAAAKAARKGQVPPSPQEPNLRPSNLFHTRVTMAATGSTIERWGDNTATRGTVLIELHQANADNLKLLGQRVAVGESRCDPTDKWNAVTGLKLAWKRLIEDLCKNRPEFREYNAFRWQFGAEHVVDQFTKITTVGGAPVPLMLELAVIAESVSRACRASR